MRRTPDLRDLTNGAAAGVVATVAMSLAMAVARLLGLGGREPPQRIAEALLDAAGIERGATGEAAAALALHHAFGAGAGVGYRVLRRLTQVPGPALLHGVGWGFAVWAVSYAGWVPALRLLPSAGDDRRDRQVRLVVAHLVYGAVLGALADPARSDRR